MFEGGGAFDGKPVVTPVNASTYHVDELDEGQTERHVHIVGHILHWAD